MFIVLSSAQRSPACNCFLVGNLVSAREDQVVNVVKAGRSALISPALHVAHIVIHDDGYELIHRVDHELIDPVNFEADAVLLLDQPGGQWPGERNIGAGTGDKESDVPFPGDVAQHFRIRGAEE